MNTNHLPLPSPVQQARSARLSTQIRRLIVEQNGWLPFDVYMNAALYTPKLGYYSSDDSPFSDFSEHGDFITAPMLTPLFGTCIAEQAIEIFERTGQAHILEFGAGNGQLAVDILQHLTKRGVHAHYSILELSATLRIQQQATIADAGYHAVTWLHELPHQFIGLMIGNEVLDAMPVKLIGMRHGKWFERGVTWMNDQLTYQDRATQLSLPTDANWQKFLCDSGGAYLSETQLQQAAFIKSIGECLDKGAVLMIDYGFPQHEFYHPQRNTGTLMCHIQHVAHDNALYYPGVQDITAHVNFSALKNAGAEVGLNAVGYTNQANFLLNTGILQRLALIQLEHQRVHANRVNKLLSEAEMGELFKVMAWEKGLNMEHDDIFVGFECGDRLSFL